MILLSLRQVSLAFGSSPLLDGVDLQVSQGERICLLGRNGAGKSSLLSLLAGTLLPDAGVVDRRQGLRIASLPQSVPQDLAGTVFDTVVAGAGADGPDLGRYHQLSRRIEAGEESLLPELLEVQHRLDEAGAWLALQRVNQVLAHLKLSADDPVENLSGGVKRRVLLARALAAEPELLLLDEPTNHLDIESIAWLEEYLLRSGITLLFITHDRSFLRALATRILELDRGRILDVAGGYDTFLLRREEMLHAETLEWARFDRKLSQEEVWIRQGIKARRTRNEGRVRALKTMREERRLRRERTGASRLQLHEAERSGQLVAELTGVDFAFGERPVIRDLSLTVQRGDRVGIIGPNGSGKTTLLKLLLGELAPQSGTVRLGTNLQTLYFDQLREQLDPDQTVQQNLSGDQDTVLVGGTPRHVYGYLKDFLFSPDRARTPVRILSGGERNRLLLARLFTREANLLVLDEPTNDLDLETLDLLEELLGDFRGTVFLVSHDRDFLNRIATSTLVFEGDGRVAEYVGGYDDWLRQRPQPKPEPAVAAAKTEKMRPERERPRKLTFRERQELSALPQRIEALEAELAGLHEKMADPEFYRAQGPAVAEATARLPQLEAELEAVYARWEELEALAD